MVLFPKVSNTNNTCFMVIHYQPLSPGRLSPASFALSQIWNSQSPQYFMTSIYLSNSHTCYMCVEG